MPFASTINHSEQYWFKHFSEFIKPLVEQTGVFEAYRSKPLRGDVLKATIANLVSANLVIADITDSDPNVFWELGVRQSFKSGTIVIAERGTCIPFDISAKGILFYSSNDPKNEEFIHLLLEAIINISMTTGTPDSHVLDTISGRGTLVEISKKNNTRKGRRKHTLIKKSKAKEDSLSRVEALIDEAKRLFE